MAAYLIAHFTPKETAVDSSKYVEVTGRLVKEYGARHLAANEHEQVEGPSLGVLSVIVEFPSIEAARGFWNHPDYQAVVDLRKAGGDFQIVLVDAAEIDSPFVEHS